jgi:hypothetical protein
MSIVADALKAVQQALQLSAKVDGLQQRMAELMIETRDHDRRLTRLEAKWEAAVELASIQRPGQGRLKDPG